jgi:RNA polymerase sigma-70 factor (ECF subfamily)
VWSALRCSGPALEGAIVATVVQREAPDKELIGRAEQGDRDAFAALYRRHFQGLYDFALRIVRDDDLAADVVQSTFVKAWDAARKRKEVGNVKAWLYTIAHNLAIDELRLRKRLAEPSSGGRGEEGGFPFAVVDPSRFSDPEAVVQDRELVELVWDSASALNPQEYALLDLHLRRGLDADELSRHLSLAKSAVYTRLSRLRDSLEEAVTSTLLMRRGRRECIDLDWLLEELRATEATQPVRRAIKQHLAACERCQESKRRLVSPAEIFAGISLVPVTLELQSQVWERVAGNLGLGTTAAAADGPGADAAATGDMGLNGAGGELIATPVVDSGVSSLVGAKSVALSALATGVAVVTATTLIFTGGGKVEDPGDVQSTSHAVGRSSTDNIVKMAWSRVQDADAYSVSWSRGSALPDQVADLDGDATGAKSPPLAPGRWYFNLRTRGDGDWTSTVHVGPFVIVRERAELVRRDSKPRPRRPSVQKHRLQAKTAQERPTASQAKTVQERPTATTPVYKPAVTGVAGVAATKRPQESGEKTEEKASPATSSPPQRTEPVAETNTPQQRSEPVAQTTTATPPPPATPLSPQPPPAPVDDDETEEDEAERDEKPQDEAERVEKPQDEAERVEKPQDEATGQEQEEAEEDEEEEDKKPRENRGSRPRP